MFISDHCLQHVGSREAHFPGLFKHYQLKEWPCVHSHWLLRWPVNTTPTMHILSHTNTSVLRILFTPTHTSYAALKSKHTLLSRRVDISELYLHCKEALQRVSDLWRSAFWCLVQWPCGRWCTGSAWWAWWRSWQCSATAAASRSSGQICWSETEECVSLL